MQAVTKPYGTIFAIGGERSQNRVFARFSRFRCWTFRRQLRQSPERRTMKKLNKVAMLFASAALAAPRHAHLAQAEVRCDNWRSGDGTPSGRTAPAKTAGATPAGRRPLRCRDCDGALKPPPPPAPAPARRRRRPRRRRRRRRPPPPPPPPPPPAPVSEKVTFAADAFFDFGKSVLKPEAQGQAR